MKHTLSLRILSLSALSVVLLVNPGTAQSLQSTSIEFKPPVRLKADGMFIGVGRRYPSPSVQDVNGDSLPDILIGDLFGRLTFAARQGGSTKGLTYSGEQAMKDRRGEALKFHNW